MNKSLSCKGKTQIFELNSYLDHVLNFEPVYSENHFLQNIVSFMFAIVLYKELCLSKIAWF